MRGPANLSTHALPRRYSSTVGLTLAAMAVAEWGPSLLLLALGGGEAGETGVAGEAVEAGSQAGPGDEGGAPLLSLSLREAGYGAHNVAQAGATDTLLLLASLSGMRPAAYVLLASFVISAASLYLALSWRLYVEAGMGGAAPPHEWWWWRCVVAAAGLAGTALHENSMRTMFALHLRLEAGSEGRRTPPRAPRPTSHQISQTSDRTSDISQISGEISHELGASRRSPRSRSASGGALRSASRSSRQSRDSDGDVSEVSDISHEISHVLGEMSDVLGEMSDLEHRDVRRFGASRLLTTPGSSRRLFAPIRNASPLFDADGTTSPSLGQALRGASSEFLARVRLPLPTPHAPTPRMRTPTYTPRMRARTQTPRTHAPRTPPTHAPHTAPLACTQARWRRQEATEAQPDATYRSSLTAHGAARLHPLTAKLERLNMRAAGFLRPGSPRAPDARSPVAPERTPTRGRPTKVGVELSTPSQGRQVLNELARLGVATSALPSSSLSSAALPASLSSSSSLSSASSLAVPSRDACFTAARPSPPPSPLGPGPGPGAAACTGHSSALRLDQHQAAAPLLLLRPTPARQQFKQSPAAWRSAVASEGHPPAIGLFGRHGTPATGLSPRSPVQARTWANGTP